MGKLIYFIFVLFACQSVQKENIESITADQLKEFQKQGLEVVDIRTPKEYASGHIPKVPNIDFMDSNFSALIGSKNMNEPIVIHCASGGRSKSAANQLIELGFIKVYDYSGGFSDWKKRGEEVEK